VTQAPIEPMRHPGKSCLVIEMEMTSVDGEGGREGGREGCMGGLVDSRREGGREGGQDVPPQEKIPCSISARR